MPKVLVLLLDLDDDAARIAAAAMDGAARVRFTEVDLRAAGERDPIAGRRCRPLESPTRASEYDGLLLVAADPRSTAVGSFVGELRAHASEHTLANLVIALATAQPTPSLDAIATLGGIIVTDAGPASDTTQAAQRLGARVAKVAAWVRHSLDHEHQDAHAHHHHHHDHAHEHDHPQGAHTHAHGHSHHHEPGTHGHTHGS